MVRALRRCRGIDGISACILDLDAAALQDVHAAALPAGAAGAAHSARAEGDIHARSRRLRHAGHADGEERAAGGVTAAVKIKRGVAVVGRAEDLDRAAVEVDVSAEVVLAVAAGVEPVAARVHVPAAAVHIDRDLADGGVGRGVDAVVRRGDRAAAGVEIDARALKALHAGLHGDARAVGAALRSDDEVILGVERVVAGVDGDLAARDGEVPRGVDRVVAGVQGDRAAGDRDGAGGVRIVLIRLGFDAVVFGSDIQRAVFDLHGAVGGETGVRGLEIQGHAAVDGDGGGAAALDRVLAGGAVGVQRAGSGDGEARPGLDLDRRALKGVGDGRVRALLVRGVLRVGEGVRAGDDEGDPGLLIAAKRRGGRAREREIAENERHADRALLHGDRAVRAAARDGVGSGGIDRKIRAADLKSPGGVARGGDAGIRECEGHVRRRVRRGCRAGEETDEQRKRQRQRRERMAKPFSDGHGKNLLRLVSALILRAEP